MIRKKDSGLSATVFQYRLIEFPNVLFKRLNLVKARLGKEIKSVNCCV